MHSYQNLEFDIDVRLVMDLNRMMIFSNCSAASR